jgi:glutaredoxin 3
MKALVWSKYGCTFCDQAKDLLELKGYEIEERKIGDGYTKEDLLESVPTARTLPQIFVERKYVGGFADLQQYFEETTSNYGDGAI